MAIDEYTIPAHVLKGLTQAGFSGIDTSMTESITKWWHWYTASDKWYSLTNYVGNRSFKTERLSCHPARRVCREWASLILDDDTKFTAGDPKADAWLKEWIDATKFVENGQKLIERSFALGTGAFALWFDIHGDVTTIKARRYDARMVIPLTWDDDGCAECAFATRATKRGKSLDQLQMHVFDTGTGTYHIKTLLWLDNKPYTDASIIADFDTKTPLKTFELVMPAVDNVIADMSAYGQSVFEDAIGAVKSVDNAFDSMSREIDATKVKVFMDETLFDVVDENGKKVPVPMSPENTVIRKVATAGGGSQAVLETFSPDIRIDALKTAMDTALAELGDLTGFGSQYFRFDQAGGLKTATEVSADNSALMRNIKKHENKVGGALETLLESLLDCARIHAGVPVPQGCSVKVDFDDSIITDTAAAKTMMLTEITAGIAEPWEYRVRFYGEDETTARAACGGDTVDPTPAAEPIV